jgi:hydroxyethylthiazole kinase-like sugar kinase family protein
LPTCRLAGELAADVDDSKSCARGPGSVRVRLIDELYLLDRAQLEDRVHVDFLQQLDA